MFEYMMIALLSVLTISLALLIEKEKRTKLDLIIELENSKETTNSLYKEYNDRVKSLNQMIRDNSDIHQSTLNRLEDSRNEVNHYKNMADANQKANDILQTRINVYIEDNTQLVTKVNTLSEQLLFATGAKEADKPQTDPVADSKSQGTVTVSDGRVTVARKPRRPRARGNKQSL